MKNKKKETQEMVYNYLKFFPEDKDKLSLLVKQIGKDKDFFTRKNSTGHIVTNALILNESKVLTIFHNKLKIFIQPGGHVDNTDNSVLDASVREVKEETGIEDLKLNLWHKENNIPIFVESHLIPENSKKNEKEHYHHDFMYIFEVKNNNVKLQLEEVSDFKWVKIKEILEKDPSSFIGISLKRMSNLNLIDI